jgi:hypothetical protein
MMQRAGRRIDGIGIEVVIVEVGGIGKFPRRGYDNRDRLDLARLAADKPPLAGLGIDRVNGNHVFLMVCDIGKSRDTG